MQDHVTKSHDVGTIQYTEWLILIDRVQPSFIAGVTNIRAHVRRVHSATVVVVVYAMVVLYVRVCSTAIVYTERVCRNGEYMYGYAMIHTGRAESTLGRK